MVRRFVSYMYLYDVRSNRRVIYEGVYESLGRLHPRRYVLYYRFFSSPYPRYTKHNMGIRLGTCFCRNIGNAISTASNVCVCSSAYIRGCWCWSIVRNTHVANETSEWSRLGIVNLGGLKKRVLEFDDDAKKADESYPSLDAASFLVDPQNRKYPREERMQHPKREAHSQARDKPWWFVQVYTSLRNCTLRVKWYSRGAKNIYPVDIKSNNIVGEQNLMANKLTTILCFDYQSALALSVSCVCTIRVWQNDPSAFHIQN